MSNPRVIYTPRPDATPEGERVQLAAVYRIILDCHTKKNAAGHLPSPDGHNAEERFKNDSSAKLSIHDE